MLRVSSAQWPSAMEPSIFFNMGGTNGFSINLNFNNRTLSGFICDIRASGHIIIDFERQNLPDMVLHAKTS